MRRALVLALIFSFSLSFSAAAARADECPRAPAHDPAAAAPVFNLLATGKLEHLRAELTEEKHIALLARPLRSTGTLYFDRTRGIARVIRTPTPERVVLSATSLRVEKNGKSEEVPLDRSKSLRGFAIIFPALLRGDRAALETTFDVALDGAPQASWSLTLLPKDPALCRLIRKVSVSGQADEVRGLTIEEASGDTTETHLGKTARNEAVSAAEITEAFGAR